MKALWQVKPPTQNIASLKCFHDTVETHIQGLRSLGKTEDLWGLTKTNTFR
jgi:hypothetical protein